MSEPRQLPAAQKLNQSVKLIYPDLDDIEVNEIVEDVLNELANAIAVGKYIATVDVKDNQVAELIIYSFERRNRRT